MSFKKNDRVRVNAEGWHSQHGQVGTVDRVYTDGTCFTVRLDNGNFHSFFLRELELVDEKREALIELAETLDKARLQANAIETTAPQRGVYGKIAVVLTDTLEQVFEGNVTHAFLTYDAMVESGLTVREALASVVK
jgi:hypothetical protein